MNEGGLDGARDRGSTALFRFHPFEFDPAAGLVYRGDEETLLPPKAAHVLRLLLENAGQLVSTDELLETIWEDAYVTESSRTDAISLLRRVLGDDTRDPTYIQTLHRRGYRFIGSVADRGAPDPDAESEAAPSVEPGLPQEGGLKVGDRLGNYEILGVLGAGAMGTVYRARDDTLDREVAVKLLRGDVANDPERLARLEREAKLLASVSHANIAAIYSLEEADGIRFPVLELVEGETLEERLRAGRIGVDEALEIARQIASALDAAHQRGIIHRDLKPANIKCTPEGQVKVLDFGLAKGLEVIRSAEDAAELAAATMTIKGTGRGSIVGTAAYMSPEQARGQDVDKRADIWSFGCVLYEMLTGMKPFARETLIDTLAAVLDKEPDLDALPASTPSMVRHLVRRCLRKDPDRRLHDIADARIEIEESIGEPGEMLAAAAAPAVAPAGWQRTLSWSLTVLAIAFAVVVGWSQLRSVPQHTSRYFIESPEGNDGFVVSPDGKTLIYAAMQDGVGRLYRRAIERDAATPIPGTDDVLGTSLTFSPDGQWIAFATSTDRTLKKMRLADETIVTISDLGFRNLWGVTWATDDTIILAMDADGIWAVPAAGGDARLVAEPRPETRYRWPSKLPGGNAVLIHVRRVSEKFWAPVGDWSIGVVEWDTGELTDLGIEGTYPRYLPSGHILFGRFEGQIGGDTRPEGPLLAAAFDPERRELKGEPVSILQDVAVFPSGYAAFDLSDDGSLFYTTARLEATRSLVWLDRDGNKTLLSQRLGPYRTPRLSPDGTKVAYRLQGVEGNQIWIHDIERDTPRMLTTQNGYMPMWSPNAEWVYFSSASTLHRRRSDFTGDRQLVQRERTGHLLPTSIFPGGDRLIFGEFRPGELFRIRDIWQLPLEDMDSATPVSLVATDAQEGYGQISPDGMWLAYAATRSGQSEGGGQWEVFVREFPDGPPYQISTDGGTQPMWSHDGSELFYLGDRMMMAVAIQTEPEFDPGTPEPLFEWTYTRGGSTFHYSVARDGRFMALAEQPVEWPPTKINVVLNYFDELRRLVPGGR